MSFPSHTVMKVAVARPDGRHPARLSISDWTQCVIGGISGLVFLFSLIGVLILLPVSAAAQEPTRRVLILSASDPSYPGFSTIANKVVSTLRGGSRTRVEVLFELQHDLVEPPESPGSDEELASHLKWKYADKKLDLIVSFAAPRIRILLAKDPELFRNVPKIFYEFDSEREATNRSLGPNITGVWANLDLNKTLDLALALHPDTRKVVVVTGNGTEDNQKREMAQAEFRKYEKRAEFSYITGNTIEELKGELAALDKRSVVIFLMFSRDKAGNRYSGPEAISIIAPASNAPIYGYADTLMGLGITGGNLLDFEGIGGRLGEMGLRILAGEQPGQIPQEVAPTVMTVDWRELQRWGVSERNLPPGSVVRFRQPSFWESYKWYIVGLVAACIVEALLIAGLLINRSRRKRAEDARRRAQIDLEENRARLAGVIESAMDGIITVDQDDRILLFNDAAEKMFVCSGESALGQSIDRFIPDRFSGTNGDPVRLIVETTATGHTTGSISAIYGRRTDGAQFPIEVSISQLETGGQKLNTMILRDITERKKAEQELRESEDRFRNMADTAPVLIWTSDTNKLGIYFNKQWLEFTGRMLEQELGNGWTEGIHPDDYQRCVDTCAAAFDARLDFHMEFRLRRNDGEYRWVVDTGVPRFTPDGTFSGYIGSCIDITERKRADEALLQTRAELARISSVLTTGEMAATIAHEVRQPLTAVVANANAARRMLMNGKLDLEETRKAIEDIVKDAHRASEVVGRVRSLFRKAQPRTEPLVINDIIEEVVSIVRSDFERNGVSVQKEMDAGLPSVEADRVEMQQVLLNLMMNAIYAMGPVEDGARNLVIKTSTGPAGDVRLELEDSGVGIPSENLERIFDAFYTTRHDGMGMGLSICRTIVEAHGGRLWAETNTDKGATFRLSLPASIKATA